MSVVALFAWLQGADFYRAMHAAAAALLPPGADRTWLDVGCGPGVLARIAAGRGYAARGVDRDARMIARAQEIARADGSAATFAVGDIETAGEAGERFDVVSASSLLVVLDNPAAGLRRLLALAKPGGVVLIIEASPRMSRLAALKLVLFGRLGRRSHMVLVWATARSSRALPESIFDQTNIRARRYPLLHGLANAWLVKRA